MVYLKESKNFKRLFQSPRKEEEERLKKFVFFKSRKIPQFEADVLQAFESQLGKQFTPVNRANCNTQMGFSVGRREVTGIGLYNCGVSTLPESVINITSLKTLSVTGYQLDSRAISVLKKMINRGVRVYT